MNREQLIAAMESTAVQKPTPVPVPSWGTVYVRPVTVEEADANSEIKDPEDGKHRRLARGAAAVLCDEAGARIFDPNKEADVDLIQKQPWTVLRKILSKADASATDDSGN